MRENELLQVKRMKEGKWRLKIILVDIVKKNKSIKEITKTIYVAYTNY